MTMDFYPPRSEQPARGIRFLALALPIGVVGYWFVSWSLLGTAVFAAFLGLVEVLLYRRGARTRVIRRGRTSLLVSGSVVVVLSVLGGAAVSVIRLAEATFRAVEVPLAGGTTDPALLGALIGTGAGIGSLVYFVRYFGRPRPVG